MDETPQYLHWSDCCTFLGRFTPPPNTRWGGSYDLYACVHGKTLLARCGNDGPDYDSSPPTLVLRLALLGSHNLQGEHTSGAAYTAHSPLVEAYRRAYEDDLIDIQGNWIQEG